MDGITILAGAGTPTPLPRDVLRSLERVEIVTALGERGSFRLSFHPEPDPRCPRGVLV